MLVGKVNKAPLVMSSAFVSIILWVKMGDNREFFVTFASRIMIV